MEHFEIKKIENYLNTKFATNLYEEMMANQIQ